MSNLPAYIFALLSIPLALLYANAIEWVAHRYLLHGVGKKKTSMWNFHWGEHHRNCRRHDHIDPSYERSVFGWHAQGKEALGIALMVVAHLPLAPWAPLFVATLLFTAAEYMYKHGRSHRDPAWAREHLTWHYDHHMGKNQDANWGVTHPWFDQLLGTRVHYAFTEAEAADLARRGVAANDSPDRRPSVPPPAGPSAEEHAA